MDGKLQRVDVKTRKSRRGVNLPPMTLNALNAQRTRQRFQRKLAGPRWQENGIVFATAIGTPMDPRNYKRALDAALERAKIPHVRIHDLRHTAVSLLIAQGVYVLTISEIIGHTKVSTTLDLYGHPFEPARVDAVNKMHDILTIKRDVYSLWLSAWLSNTENRPSSNGWRASFTCKIWVGGIGLEPMTSTMST